jgi:threonine/homoserine/homoserine lactone efflux protein
MPLTHAAAVATVPLALFMFVSSITPGPNNLMLMNSGIRYGLRRTLPHAVGVSTGLAVVMALSYAGVGALLLARPSLLRLMTIACAGYLVWLAVALMRSADTAPPERTATDQGRAMRPLEAVLFQFVNPKVWAMTVTACSIAASFPLTPLTSFAVLVLLSSAVNFPCVSAWAVFGDRLRRQLQDRRFRYAFNAAMAALVLATAVWMVMPVIH